jgi:hypothetical protein
LMFSNTSRSVPASTFTNTKARGISTPNKILVKLSYNFFVGEVEIPPNTHHR